MSSIRVAASPSTDSVNARARGQSSMARVSTVLPLTFIGLLILVAIAAPILSPADPNVQHLDIRLQPPNPANWLGTDDLGRDVLSRLIWAARVSLMVGVGSTALAFVVGVPLGFWAGYGQGWSSGLVMRVADVLLAFPSVLLAMLTATVLGSGIVNVAIAIAIVTIPTFIRIARAVMLSQRHLEYVEAARAFAASHAYIMFRSVLPNTIGPLAVQTALSVASAMLLEAGLSFLGLGVQPPTPSWGLMLQQARGYLRQDPWLGVFPGLVLLLAVLALNSAADTVARIADPHRRVSE